jgi:hypothetical protein
MVRMFTLVAALVSAAAAPAADRPPNVVLILADDKDYKLAVGDSSSRNPAVIPPN